MYPGSRPSAGNVEKNVEIKIHKLCVIIQELEVIHYAINISRPSRHFIMAGARVGGVVIWGTCIGREGGIPSRYNRRVFRERYKYNERAIKV